MITETLSLPSAIEVEEQVLGCMLTDSGDDTIDVINKLDMEDFFNRSNRFIFEAVKSLHGLSHPFDVVSVTTHLNDRGILSDVGGNYHISSLSSCAVVGFMALRGVETLKEKTRLRKMIEMSENIKAMSYANNPSTQISDFNEKEILEITKNQSEKNLLKSGISRVHEMIRSRRAGEKIYGIPTGIKSFDDIFFGLQKSQYYVIGGRPSSGKTAFIDQVSWKMIDSNIPTLYVPLESSEDRTIGKIACKMAKISYTRFIHNECNESELNAIERMVVKIEKSDLHIKRPQRMTAECLHSLIIREIRRNGIQVFMIDYLQKINQGGNNDRTSIAAASDAVQNICVETGAIGIVLVQINREAEKESRPRMGHIKESGQIEQDADNICLFWGEKENHELSPGEMKPVIMTVEKNKDGIQGVDQKLLFDRELMTFKERHK